MNNKVVLVTGSSIGLGTSTILEFAKHGYNVVINYLTHEKEALALKEKVEKEYHINALVIKADITKEDDVNNMLSEILKCFKQIDVLINNAAIAIDCEVNSKTKANFMKTLEVNLYGTFLVSKTIGNQMLKNKSGKIINISSTNGIDTYYEYSLDYDASKAGVINLTHNLASIYAPYINVNCICPGWIDTPMNKNLDEDMIKDIQKSILLKRIAHSSEIAKVIYFVGSDDASYINDAIIRVDGGEK